LEEALATPSISEELELRARVEIVLLDIQVGQHSDELDEAALARLGARIDASSDRQTVAYWRMALGSIHELEGRSGAAAAEFAQALALAEAADLPRIRGDALARVLLNELLGATPVADILARCEQVIAASTEPHVLASTLDSYALALTMAGRLDEAARAEERAIGIVNELDARLDEALYRAQTVTVTGALAGLLEAARAEGERGCTTLLELEAHGWLSTAACILGEICLATADLDAAERWLGTADQVSTSSDVDARVRALVLRARLLSYRAQPEAAAPFIREAHQLVDGGELLYLRGVVAAAEACIARAASDEATAQMLFEAAAQLHARKGDVAREQRARSLSADPRGGRATALV